MVALRGHVTLNSFAFQAFLGDPCIIISQIDAFYM
jgi:hypothetical protein